MDGKLNLSMDLAFTGNYFNSLPLLVNEADNLLETDRELNNDHIMQLRYIFRF